MISLIPDACTDPEDMEHDVITGGRTVRRSVTCLTLIALTLIAGRCPGAAVTRRMEPTGLAARPVITPTKSGGSSADRVSGCASVLSPRPSVLLLVPLGVWRFPSAFASFMPHCMLLVPRTGGAL